ncbi:MAG: N-formylglutamate amidohydrolase [Legionellales bacterium]|nr:N-formylglutamate amidohydrolase [Legionellales bacterium]
MSNSTSIPALFITCEHGGNDIPEDYRYLFAKAATELATHRGYDIGALSVFTLLEEAKLADFYHSATTSRLFVELNRSPGHPRLWSEFTCDLSSTQKEEVLWQYYYSYRNGVEANISDAINREQRVIHLSIHSFTPELDGKIREAEVGLLYDSRRPLEKQFCGQWQQELLDLAPTWRVRANYPYRGSSDGFTTYLRKQFTPEQYLGIELEINQKILKDSANEVGVVIRKSIKRMKKWILK